MKSIIVLGKGVVEFFLILTLIVLLSLLAILSVVWGVTILGGLLLLNKLVGIPILDVMWTVGIYPMVFVIAVCEGISKRAGTSSND